MNSGARMRLLSVLLVVALQALSPGLSAAEPGVDGGAEPRAAPGAQRRELPPAVAPAQGRGLFGREPFWAGPRVKLSYRVLSLHDSQGGRLAQTAGFAGFLPTRFVRAGGGIDAGARRHDVTSSEGFVSASAFAGYQLLRRAEPAVPYAVAVGEIGLVFGKQFHTPVSNMIRGAGLEIGCDLRWVRGLSTSVGALFMLYTMDGLAYPSWGLRVSVGL